MTTFLHIAFTFRGSPKVKELEPVMGKALDWIRYAPNCWIVRTTASPGKWMARLKQHLGAGDLVLIVALDLEHRSGRLPQWVWDWIRKYQTARSG